MAARAENERRDKDALMAGVGWCWLVLSPEPGAWRRGEGEGAKRAKGTKGIGLIIYN